MDNIEWIWLAVPVGFAVAYYIGYIISNRKNWSKLFPTEVEIDVDTGGVKFNKSVPLGCMITVRYTGHIRNARPDIPNTDDIMSGYGP
jgi:hypothetical protein